MSGVWIFGYGSLVSPDSFGHTLQRRPQFGVDFFEAELAEFGRRWNYGSLSAIGRAADPSGTVRDYAIVALGVSALAGETVHGTIGWVSNDELVALDRRERYYDRVDVTGQASVVGAEQVAEPVMTYVPRREAVERYEQMRDRGEAAVDQRYFDLVDRAFGDLGEDRRERYHDTTPAPDIPVLPLQRDLEAHRYGAAERL